MGDTTVEALLDFFRPHGSTGGMPVAFVNESRWIRRTWRERLFTRPWHPLEAGWWTAPILEEGEVYRMGDMLLMRRATFEELQRSIRNETN